MAASYHFHQAMNSAPSDYEQKIAKGLYELAHEVERLKSELSAVKSRVGR